MHGNGENIFEFENLYTVVMIRSKADHVYIPISMSTLLQQISQKSSLLRFRGPDKGNLLMSDTDIPGDFIPGG